MSRVDARGWFEWVLLAIAIAVAWFSIEAQKPPDAKPADAPLDEFSSGRAMAHVAAIARAPHPTGSPEAGRVRDFVVKKLAEIGLTAEIQTPKDKQSKLRNVVARRKGRGSPGKKVLLLCSHYDSVSFGPGAGDNASGVAVVLETLRAIDAGPPVERDVIVLFDDGEEAGLLGAKLFVDEHPWAKDVGVVLNFDARGVSGPSFMFETSDKNGWLIHQFALASPHPLATSVSMDVYRIMPNDTNLTVFRRAGLAGLNFAFAGGSVYYHTGGDSPANLDPRTLEHQGENTIALTRHLGGLDLDETSGEDVIYASILGRMVMAYPQNWSRPIAVATGVAFLVAVGVGLWSRRVTIAGLAVGIVTWLIATVASIFCAQAFWVVLREIMIGLGVVWLQFDVGIMTLCSMVAAAVSLAVARRAARRRSLESLALGALTWWLVLAITTAWWLPNSSYLFAWPAVFALVGLSGMMLANPASALARVWMLIGAVPALVLMPPVIRNTFDGLGPRMAGLLMILVTLFLGAVLPLLEPLLAAKRR